MLPYWLLLLIPAAAIFINRSMVGPSQVLIWWGVWLFYVLAVGLRFEVGGDWFSYINHLEMRTGASMTQVLLGSDPGYYLINWVVAQFDGSIAWVNVACAIVLVTGVLSFARSQPLPWLAFFVAVPYLIIVVGMGYTRQSAALGFLLIGLVAIGNGRMKTFVIW